jgi:phage-related protein
LSVFTYTPDYPLSESSQPRASRTAFPSYEERTTFGINPLQDTWDLSFSARTAADRNDIYAFLEACGGVEPFEWTTPFNETGCFICNSWETSLDSCFLNTLTAKFELQYVPGGPNLTLPAAPSTAFSYIPDYAATKSYETQSRTTQFGDGYRQRMAFGLRPQKEEWRLTFNNRTNTQRDLIRNYLRGAKAVTAFAWTDPISAESIRVVCAEWNTQYSNFNNSAIQATFRRVYEP